MSDARLTALSKNCATCSDPGSESSHAKGDGPHRPRAAAMGKDDSTRAFPTGVNLRPYADQLMRIAEQLRRTDLAEASDSAAAPRPASDDTGEHGPGDDRHQASSPLTASAVRARLLPLDQRRQAYAAMARATYAVRRKRSAIFGDAELFGEPAWDILLDLYIASAEGKTVSVSSACIGSASPPTTGLRWLGVLAEHDLVLREHDPRDQRRVLVRLTEKGLSAMDRYFASASAERDSFGAQDRSPERPKQSSGRDQTADGG